MQSIISQITPEMRNKRINEIPYEKADLQRKLKVAIRQNWIGQAASLKKEIKDLEIEFKELYNSY